MKEKPHNLPLRTFIQRRMSVELAMPEEVINTVIDHCFGSAREALTNNFSVEIAGFGKFVFNRKNAEKHLIKIQEQLEGYKELLNDDSLPEKKRVSIEGKIKTWTRNVEALKIKLKGYES
jgi:nucleoid DNA-binding protein